jgi:hypothetical protein
MQPALPGCCRSLAGTASAGLGWNYISLHWAGTRSPKLRRYEDIVVLHKPARRLEGRLEQMATIEQHSEYPLNNAAYDVMVIVHEKSKALQAYEHYLQDLQHDTALRQALVQIRHDDQRHIETLMAHLQRLLSEDKGKDQ